MDLGVRPVAVSVEKAAEGVFHGAGHLCENVGLDGGELDDVGAQEHLGDVDAVFVDVV